jgi:hypothetical protein
MTRNQRDPSGRVAWRTTGSVVGPPVIGRRELTLRTRAGREASAGRTVCDVSSVAISCAGLTTNRLRAAAAGEATADAATVATATATARTRVNSGRFVMHASLVVELGDDKTRAAAIGTRAA